MLEAKFGDDPIVRVNNNPRVVLMTYIWSIYHYLWTYLAYESSVFIFVNSTQTSLLWTSRKKQDLWFLM